MATVRPNVEDIVAHIAGVKRAVNIQAREIGHRAERRLARHRETGASKVEVTRGRVDSFVSLVDPAALSIEFGRSAYENERGRVGAMQGLYIVTGAAFGD